MDEDLSTWLAAFVALDEIDDDALFSALICESPRGSSRSSGLDARAQRLLTVDGVSPAHGSVASNRREDAQQPPVKKRKKRGTWRAKDEIERLRRVAIDLESLISLRAQRRAETPKEVLSHSNALAIGSGVWRGVAMRQLQRLRASLQENQQLRVQVQQQLAMSKSLARLVLRARRSTFSHSIPRNPEPLDDATIAFKRQELIAAMSAMFQSLHGVVNDNSLGLSSEEFRSTQTFAKLSDPTPPPGAILAESTARRLVPIELSELGERFWGQLQGMEVDGGRHKLNIQHIERFPEFYLMVHSFDVPTDQGIASFHAIGARARLRSSSRDITVAAGSLWPGSSAPPNIQSPGFDVRTWTITQPHAASAELSEVRYHAEFSRARTRESTWSARTGPQSGLLDDIVAGTQSYMLSENDRLLDAVLLP